jgi:3-oxoacyl-[acyl-carrier protein] reductase
MFAAAPPERREQAKHMSPFGRLGEPADIADVVAFLVSEQARWITGQIVPVNGGIA